METRKLYYEDCLLRSFTARVLDCTAAEKGWLVELDSTAFYPEGGGQACDLGQLGAAGVLDVREKEGRVLHLCDAPLEKDTEVTGCIDWERRFDQMQQHAGEHIVSGLLHQRFGCHNVGFHVGADVVTIDFDQMIPWEVLLEVEQAANRAVWQNLPVKCWYPGEAELPKIPYRSKKQLPWPVRIVEFPGYDLCACCGVHVAYTGQIGIIKLLSCVKFHQGVRIEMACGGRALSLLSRVYEQNRQVSQAFSAKLLETGAAARKMNETLAEETLRGNTLQKQTFAYIARDYAGQGDVVHFAPGLSSGSVRELADAVAQSCGGVAAVFSGEDAEGYSFCLVSKAGDVADLGKALTRALDGRGGGKAGFFQGSVKATQGQIREFFQK